MRSRLIGTTRELMALVGLAALGLGAFRVHPALGWFVSTVLVLALVRTREMTARLPPSRPWAVARAYLGSVVVASTVLALALIPSVYIMAVAFALRAAYAPPGFGPWTVVCLILSVLLATFITIGLRRALWTPRPRAPSGKAPSRERQAKPRAAGQSADESKGSIVTFR